MNSIERRVSEGLRAYGDGLSLTTQDIDRLETGLAVKEQAPPRQRRRGLWRGALAACVVAGLAVGALVLRDDPDDEIQPVGPPVTLAQLEGIWRVDDSDWLWRFSPDGTVTQSNQPDLLTGAGTVPAFTVRPAPGGFIAKNGPDDPEGCHVVWAATVSAQGRLRAAEVSQGPACPGAGVDPTYVWEFTRVSPFSVAGAASIADGESQQPHLVTDPTQLRGTWLLRGTGTLLTVTSVERWALQDLGATDDPETGAVSVRPNGRTSFTLDTTPGCSAVYEPVTSTGTTMATELAPGSCHRLAATSDTWIRLN